MDGSMLTFFVRHTDKLSLDDDTLGMMWKERRIGIHYPWGIHDKEGKDPDTTSLDPNDYSGAARVAMQTLVELSRDGGYVCAKYRNQKHLLIGKVPSNSKIKLVYGQWQGERYPKLQGRKAIMKTLQLTSVRTISEFDHPTILVGQPQQGTIARWWRVEDLIRGLVEGDPIQISLKQLGTAQQETMSSEFLRSPHSGLPTLAHLLLPVGRTMKVFDIIGLATDGRRIFAQVTYSAFKRGGRKFQTLLPSIKEGHVVFFCQHSRQEIIDGVAVVPIDDVFQEFTNTPTGKQWLELA